MEFLKKALDALPQVAASPMAFVGYVLTIAAWIYAISRSQRLKTVLDRIKDVPPSERAKVIQLELGEVLPEKITAEQWMRSKKHRYFFGAFVLLLATVLAVGAMAMWAGGASLSVDDLRVVVPSPPENQAYTFDITLRNPSGEPITATEIRAIFDQGSGSGLANVQEVSGTYVVHVDETGGTTTGPVGRFEAYAWYPTGAGELVVKAPISQTVPPKSADRIRIVIEFPNDYTFRGKMERAVFEVQWNGSRYERSKPVVLAAR
jgi:hypothetical protein